MELLCLICTCPSGFHSFVLILSVWLWATNGASKMASALPSNFFLPISDILGVVIWKWIFASVLLEEFTLFRSFEISCNTILNWQQKPLVFSENTIWSKGGSVEETIIYMVLNIQQNLNFPVQKWESGLSFVFLMKKTEPSLQNTCSAYSHWLKN